MVGRRVGDDVGHRDLLARTLHPVPLDNMDSGGHHFGGHVLHPRAVLAHGALCRLCRRRSLWLVPLAQEWKICQLIADEYEGSPGRAIPDGNDLSMNAF